MNKNAFSLVELIATVVILCIVFLFVAPRIVDVIKDSEDQNKEVVETRVIDAAKEYVISYDKTFLDTFINVGTIDYITLQELVNTGLIEQDDATELGNTASIKVELLANDVLGYALVSAPVVEVTLTVISNGGTLQAFNASYAQSTSIPLIEPTKPNYTFTNWSVTGTGASITGSVIKILTVGTENTILTANFVPTPYSISYGLDNGTPSSPNPSTYNVTSNTITLNNPTKANFTFTGWTEGESTTKNMTVTIERGSTGAKVYTAHYEANAVSLMEALNTVGNTEGLMEDETSDQNLRYVGANPKNYVKFNGTNDKWRIIGIFDVKKSVGGTTEKRIKLIGPSIGNYSWDSSASTVNDGYGENDWVNADLNNLLNTLYYNGTSGTCYNGRSNASTSCNFSSNTLSTTAKDMIDNAVWHLGAPAYIGSSPYALPTQTTYTSERGTIVSASGRPTTHIAKIGLIYPSDYGYASTDSDCRSDMRSGMAIGTSKCQSSNNWLTGTSYWSISSLQTGVNVAFYVYSLGQMSTNNTSAAIAVRPVVYLKSGVKVLRGNGTSGANAYELSMS